MPVLTEHERNIVTGKTTGTRHEKYAAVLKLKVFQVDNTDAEHIAKIDALIPQAEAIAKEAVRMNRAARVKKILANYDRVFHGEMNRLKREAGLIN